MPNILGNPTHFNFIKCHSCQEPFWRFIRQGAARPSRFEAQKRYQERMARQVNLANRLQATGTVIRSWHPFSPANSRPTRLAMRRCQSMALAVRGMAGDYHRPPIFPMSALSRFSLVCIPIPRLGRNRRRLWLCRLSASTHSPEHRLCNRFSD